MPASFEIAGVMRRSVCQKEQSIFHLPRRVHLRQRDGVSSKLDMEDRGDAVFRRVVNVAQGTVSDWE